MSDPAPAIFTPNLRVLVVDDEPAITSVIVRLLALDDCEAMQAGSIREANFILSTTVPDVAIVDVYLTGEDGLAYVRELRRRIPFLGILVISGAETASLARMAMESGADDFLPKPFTREELRLKVRKAAELREQRRRIIELESQLQRSVRDNLFPAIVTHGDAMKSILDLVEKVAPRDLSVLVCGESGTGKELVARAIHDMSTRSKGQFVELNCAALPANLVESELFGHEKGAFTGAIATRSGKMEQAHGGTLFLDEIGELPMAIQPKLLRALQEKRITRVGGKASIDCDFRLISATNRDLMEEVRTGGFREDLFYRTAVFPIKLPALRERPEDIDLLLTHFLGQDGMDGVRLTTEAHALLLGYHWPGNVRELKNFAQAAALLARDGIIDEAAAKSYFGSRLGPAWMPARPPSQQASLDAANTAATGLNALRGTSTSYAPTAQAAPGGADPATRPVRPLAELEREEICHALVLYNGNVPEAAQALGMGRATLYKYLARHQIDPKPTAAARRAR